MANYRIDPAILEPYLPAFTRPDTWEGHTYVSLVGFQFRDVKLLGLTIPFHVHFPEVNLRFYVRYFDGRGWKRGVVFLSEIVPKPAIRYVANTLFNEKYRTMPMRVHFNQDQTHTYAGYEWRWKGRWNKLAVTAAPAPVQLAEGSEEEFITEHFWGYARYNDIATVEYEVAHPRWNIFPVDDYVADCDFAGIYGAGFAHLSGMDPSSVFLAEGSPIEVFNKTSITQSSLNV